VACLKYSPLLLILYVLHVVEMYQRYIEENFGDVAE
jgi:hypothetical protein